MKRLLALLLLCAAPALAQPVRQDCECDTLDVDSTSVMDDTLTILNDKGITIGDNTSTTNPMPVIFVDADGANDCTVEFNNALDAMVFTCPANVIFKGPIPGFVFDEDVTSAAGVDDANITLTGCASTTDCGPVRHAVRWDGIDRPVADLSASTNASDATQADGVVSVLATNSLGGITDQADLTANYTGTAATYRLDISGVAHYRFDSDVALTNNSGFIQLKDSGGTCYDCAIDTSTVTSASEKSWAFDSPAGSSGTFYFGGFYDFGASHNDFDPVINWGTANASYAAHFFVVLGDTTVDELTITVTGTTITDAGARATAQTDTIVIPDATGADAYYETDKKFLGLVTVEATGGTAKDCNYGWSKYWDNNNTDFTVVGVEATWLGGANDAAPDISLLHHTDTGWTYNAGAVPTPPTALASMDTDHSTESQVVNNEQGAYKRDNLNQAVSGSASEGTIVEVVTTANKAFELGTVLLRINAEVSSQSNIVCTAGTCL